MRGRPVKLDIEAARRMKMQGFMQTEIAERFGVSPSTVCMALKKDASVHIPAWVPPNLHSTFLRIAGAEGEEAAAAECRRLKRTAA